MKVSLERPSDEREKHDIDAIWNLIDGTDAFISYPQYVRKEIARVVQYQSNAEGSVVLQDGNNQLFSIL